MIISTFNIQNDSKVYKRHKSREIYNYIKKNKIDILGLQEVFYKCNDDLEELVKNRYSMIGKYRYRLKWLYKIKNEKNPIISKYNLLESKTYHLPSTKYNRIITKGIIKYKGKYISTYNTHIEIVDDAIKEKQLSKIIDILKSDNNPIILMGDFNTKISNKLFKDFLEQLKSINICHVDLEGNTFKTDKSNEGIDHMFISDSFKLVKKSIVKNMDISDHYPVIIEIEV